MIGKLIVFEGPDGAGKTTQLTLLHDVVRARGLPVVRTRQPSDGPFGKELRAMLHPATAGAPPYAAALSPQALSLLFAADRKVHLDTEILPWLREGYLVLCDRYDYSNFVYQSVHEKTHRGTWDAREWIQSLNRYARRPNFTIVLDVPPGVTARRRVARGAPAQYEDEATQAAVQAIYAKLDMYFPGDMIVHVDGTGTAQDVHARVLEAVETWFGPDMRPRKEEAR